MSPDDPQAGRAVVAQVVCGALLFMTAMYAAVALVMSKIGVIPEGGLAGLDDETGARLSLALVVVGALTSLVSFPVRRVLVAKIPPDGEVFHLRFRVAIVSMALAEASGVMGLVYVLLSGDLKVAFILWGIAIGTGIFHLPSRYWLEGESGQEGDSSP